MSSSRLALILAAACGSASAPASTVSNGAHAEPPASMTTKLQVYVRDARAHCLRGEVQHVEVTIDDRPVGVIVVRCFDARRVSVQARRFRLQVDPIVPEGRHRIEVRHVESGRWAARELAFPAGRPADPRVPWIELDKLPITLDDATLMLGELGI